MLKPAEFPIPIHDLDASGKPYAFSIKPSWIRTALEDSGGLISPTEKEGSIEVRVSKSGQDVIVHGTLKAELEAPCARCLTPTKVEIEEQVSVMMVPSSSLKGSKGMDDEYEFSAEEADVLPYSGDTVALDDLVRDELLLAVPMIPLCSEECTGISRPSAEISVEPAEVGIDPRLAPLLKLVPAKATSPSGTAPAPPIKGAKHSDKKKNKE